MSTTVRLVAPRPDKGVADLARIARECARLRRRIEQFRRAHATCPMRTCAVCKGLSNDFSGLDGFDSLATLHLALATAGSFLADEQVVVQHCGRPGRR